MKYITSCCTSRRAPRDWERWADKAVSKNHFIIDG